MAEKEECKVLIDQASKDAADPPREDDDEEEEDDSSSFIVLLNLVLGGTARLNVLLPTATILAFAIFAPLLTDDGKCTRLNRILTAAFVVLCAASCVFFTLTDSFRSASGRLRYGVATPTGIRTFCGGGGGGGGHRRKGPREPERYRLRWSDLFHTTLALVAFVTFAASHHDIVRCYYPGVPRKVVNTVPLVIGFVVSLLFVLFPSRRRGIGYPFLLRTDLVYLRR